jgi:hypothetical protein
MVQVVQLHSGQCGLCQHFGEHHPSEPQLIQIRLKKEAPEDLIEQCALPQHAQLDLKVTAISGCAGFAPAETPQA